MRKIFFIITLILISNICYSQINSDETNCSKKIKFEKFFTIAEECESIGKVDDALRNYYWAYLIFPNMQDLDSKSNDDVKLYEKYILIRQRINNILDKINVFVVSKNKDFVELHFDYNNAPVASLDYRYFDGAGWSKVCSVQDGRSLLELSHGNYDNIILNIEYQYKDMSHIDEDVDLVMSHVEATSYEASFRKSRITINSKVKRLRADKRSAKEVLVTESSKLDSLIMKDSSHISESITAIIDAINNSRYESVKDLFTEEGYDDFQKLIIYGRAKIIGTPNYAIYNCGDFTTVRSIPMSFSYTHSIYQSIVENVVFTFNSSGKVAFMSFKLDEPFINGILNKTTWSQVEKISLLSFIENYRTALVLKKIHYIVDVHSSDNSDRLQLRDDTGDFINHLRYCFIGKETFNVEFKELNVVRDVKRKVYFINFNLIYYTYYDGDGIYGFFGIDLSNLYQKDILVSAIQFEDVNLYSVSDF